MLKHLIPLALVAMSLIGQAWASGLIVVESVCGPNGCTPNYGARPNVPQPEAVTPHPSRCRVHVEEGNNRFAWGSGTLIDAAGGLVITNNHVVNERQGKVICIFPDGKKFEARVGQCDAQNDLAELRIQPTNIETLTVDDSEPNGVLVAGGFGPDGHFRAYTGRYVSTTLDGSLVMTGSARQGDSGGGVINAQRCWVGVLWGTEGGETYCTCGQPLKKFLDRVWPNRPAKVIGHAQPAQPPCIPNPISPPAANNPPITAGADALILASLAKIELRLSSLESKQGEPGPVGPAGPKGDTGPAGPAGSAANQQPFFIRFRNGESVSEYTPVRPGEYVTLELQPTK